jgi:hypothetical protein
VFVNVSTTSLSLRSLTAPASMLREGSVESKNSASAELNCFTVSEQATPRLGMPSQLQPITRATFDSVSPSNVIAPSIEPEKNAPFATSIISTWKSTGRPWILAARLPFRNSEICEPLICPPNWQLNGMPLMVVA